MKRLSLGALALLIAVGATACSPDSGNGPGEGSQPSSTATKSASPAPTASPVVDDSVELSKTANAFFSQIRNDAEQYQKDVSAAPLDNVSEEDVAAAFNKSYAGSISYLKQGVLNDQQVRDTLGPFASIYIGDGNASIVSAPEDFTIEGTTAVVYGGDLDVTMRGVKLPATPDEKGGALKFEKVDGKWLVTGTDLT